VVASIVDSSMYSSCRTTEWTSTKY